MLGNPNICRFPQLYQLFENPRFRVSPAGQTHNDTADPQHASVGSKRWALWGALGDSLFIHCSFWFRVHGVPRRAPGSLWGRNPCEARSLDYYSGKDPAQIPRNPMVPRGPPCGRDGGQVRPNEGDSSACNKFRSPKSHPLPLSSQNETGALESARSCQGPCELLGTLDSGWARNQKSKRTEKEAPRAPLASPPLLHTNAFHRSTVESFIWAVGEFRKTHLGQVRTEEM